MKRLLIALATASTLLATGSALGRGPATAVYQNVKAPTVHDSTNRRIKALTGDQGVPLFVVDSGELFLLTQTTRTKWWLFVEVDSHVWTPDELGKLERSHPGVSQLFPSPSTANRGIAWIEAR